MASAYLQRSTGTPTSQTQFTVSAWVKRSGLDSSNNMDIFCIYLLSKKVFFELSFFSFLILNFLYNKLK